MSYYRRRKSRGKFKPLDWIKENFTIVIISLFTIPFIFRLLFKQKTIIEQVESDNDKKIIDAIHGDPVKEDTYIQNETTYQHRKIARALYHHLGYAYSFYDPRRWTENDEDIYLLLKDYNPVPQGIYRAYYVYSKGRNLKNDLNRLLDTKYLKQLNL